MKNELLQNFGWSDTLNAERFTTIYNDLARVALEAQKLIGDQRGLVVDYAARLEALEARYKVAIDALEAIASYLPYEDCDRCGGLGCPLCMQAVTDTIKQLAEKGLGK